MERDLQIYIIRFRLSRNRNLRSSIIYKEWYYEVLISWKKQKFLHYFNPLFILSNQNLIIIGVFGLGIIIQNYILNHLKGIEIGKSGISEVTLYIKSRIIGTHLIENSWKFLVILEGYSFRTIKIQSSSRSLYPISYTNRYSEPFL